MPFGHTALMLLDASDGRESSAGREGRRLSASGAGAINQRFYITELGSQKWCGSSNKTEYCSGENMRA